MNVPFWTEEHVRATLPERDAESHKGTYGTALLLAGSDDMPGAALLAGLGAMRSGLGKLVIGTSESVIPLIVPVLPESTYWRDGWKKAADAQLEETYRAIAIGSGLPQTESVQQAVDHVLTADCPVILDAGALAKRGRPRHPHAAPGRVFPNDRGARERIAEKKSGICKGMGGSAADCHCVKRKPNRHRVS